METNAAPGKGWNIGLWVAQVLLALAFGFGGYGKLAWPMEQINAQVPWGSAIPEWLMRFIGAAELAGAIGVLVPSLTRIRPGLAPLAGSGLALIMVLAACFHLFRGEYLLILVNIVYGATAIFVFWGRAKKFAIQPR